MEWKSVQRPEICLIDERDRPTDHDVPAAVLDSGSLVSNIVLLTLRSSNKAYTIRGGYTERTCIPPPVFNGPVDEFLCKRRFGFSDADDESTERLLSAVIGRNNDDRTQL